MMAMKNLMWMLILIFVMAQSCVEETDEQMVNKDVIRMGSVIKVKPEKLDEYKALHADPWPGVNAMIKECNIRNYSIYYRDGYLFSYMEYTGNDFDADMAKLAADSLTREWWKLTDPCQEPVESAGEGVWWAEMEEVYHLD
jgi:L-rhamnose mutarotase